MVQPSAAQSGDATAHTQEEANQQDPADHFGKSRSSFFMELVQVSDCDELMEQTCSFITGLTYFTFQSEPKATCVGNL